MFDFHRDNILLVQSSSLIQLSEPYPVKKNSVLSFFRAVINCRFGSSKHLFIFSFWNAENGLKYKNGYFLVLFCSFKIEQCNNLIFNQNIPPEPSGSIYL